MDSIKGSGSVWAKMWVVRCKGYEGFKTFLCEVFERCVNFLV